MLRGVWKLKISERRGRSGAVLLEAAIILPILVGLYLATYSLISLSRTYMALSQIIREAVISAAPNIDCEETTAVFFECCGAECDSETKKECLDNIVMWKIEKLLESYNLPLVNIDPVSRMVPNDDGLALYEVKVSGNLNDNFSIFNGLTLSFAGLVDAT